MGKPQSKREEPAQEVTAQIGYNNQITHTQIEVNIGMISWCMVVILLLFILAGMVFAVRYCTKCFNKKVNRGVEAGMIRLQKIQRAELQ